MSSFLSCSQNIIAKGSSLESNVHFSHPISSVRNSSYPPLTFITLTLDTKITVFVFCTLSHNLSLSDVPAWSYSGEHHWRKSWKSHCSWCIISDGAWFQFILISMTVTLVSWFRQCLLGFSTIKLPISLL